MALRFRKSFKLAPGIRMNFSGSGASCTLGPRGASIGIGKRGTYLNAGIPGTGLYARERIGGQSSTPKKKEQPQLESVSISVTVSDDGTIKFEDGMGNDLSEKLISVAKRQNGEAIKGLIQKKCDEINQETDSVGEIHRYTPSPSKKPTYEKTKFDVLKPVTPSPKKGFLLFLLKKRREKIEAQNREALAKHQALLKLWEIEKAEFEKREENRRLIIEEGIYVNPDAMNEFLENTLQEIVWPRETIVSTEILAGGRVVFIDVDLPEIEDMPSKKAVVPANGYKLSVKELSATNVQKLYMQHTHGIAFRTIGEVFASLPKAEEVVLSGYSQRPDKATGQICDEYLLSVRVKRAAWSQIAFGNLKSIDIVEALTQFELRRSMSKTGIFKPIEPFSPEDLPLLA